MVTTLNYQSKNKESYPGRWPPPQGDWTYDDYVRLPDNGIRYEVIEGNLYMTPAPRTKHQLAVARLHGCFWDYLKEHHEGEVYFSPIDLIIPGFATPVQPDLLFISKEHPDIVQENFIEGVPDLLIEVLSPGNPMHNRRTKYDIYARAGVREYWIVDTDASKIEVYVLRGQAYALLKSFSADESACSEVLQDFHVPMGMICPP
ncbi:MAG TPA: Uma2 family endonuclease [Thermodesulfovibrionia bacterium]|nr:Uma2 family endonuclease [Thermodesulfovibrionia bacterium]